MGSLVERKRTGRRRWQRTECKVGKLQRLHEEPDEHGNEVDRTGRGPDRKHIGEGNGTVNRNIAGHVNLMESELCVRKKANATESYSLERDALSSKFRERADSETSSCSG
eukprot:tig00021122_g18451.t1